jgi:hypothetical protein
MFALSLTHLGDIIGRLLLRLIFSARILFFWWIFLAATAQLMRCLSAFPK